MCIRSGCASSPSAAAAAAAHEQRTSSRSASASTHELSATGSASHRAAAAAVGPPAGCAAVEMTRPRSKSAFLPSSWRLFPRRMRSNSLHEAASSRVVDPLDARLVPQQVPLVAFSGNFVLPFETELVLNDDEVVYDVDGNSYMKMAWLDRRDSSGAMFNRISRAICSVSGRELGVARQDMWSRSSWTVHTSDDVQLARIRMASGTARLSLATEELSVHFGCECGRDCFVVFRGDPLQCQVLASACRSAKDGVYRVRVSPFVDYVLMCVFARCVQLSGR